jgi:glutaminyl-tRNA synthetase
MSQQNSKTAAAHVTNFIRNIVDADLAGGAYADRRWGGKPGGAQTHAGSGADPAKIRTRFPPEPNGYLHFGHAKSICLNFGLARDYGGACHMRFDDTNPEKEEQEYVDSILSAVQWLGFGWQNFGDDNLYYASDYFGFMYEAAEYLITSGHAYVDQQTAEEMRVNRGTLKEPGKNSPWRERPREESLALFRAMRDGKHADGALVLRAKIDMATAPATHGASIRCTPMRTRSKTRSNASRIRSARSSSKTNGRSTTGCSSAWPREICWRARCRNRSSSRASISATSCSPNAS